MLGFSRRKKIKKKENETFLAIDIGTENVKTVLFRYKDNTISVIGYNRTKQKPFTMNKALILDAEEVLNSIDKSIGAAISEAEKLFMNLELPEDVFIGIAGELVSGVPIVVNVDWEDPNEEITTAEVENIVNKVKEHSFDSTKSEIAEENGLKEAQIAEIETVINSTSIDGVKVKSPVGLSGSEITYRVFSSFAPKIQIESIKNIAKELGLNLRKIIVEPYALANSLSEITTDPNGSIVIDMGSGTTDIAVVRDGDIIGLKMFAIGGRTFTKRIQTQFGLGYAEAEKLKLDYSLGKKIPISKSDLRAAIQTDIKSWLLGVELALEEIDELTDYPSNIYICGGGSLLPEVRDGLMEHPWIQRLSFKKHPKISYIFPNKISKVNDMTRKVVDPIDVTPLALTRGILE